MTVVARLARIAAFVLAASLSLPSIAGPSEDAEAAYLKGDFASALRLWRELAEQGDPSAQTRLGRMYRDARGVPRDDPQAVEWFRRAAEQGNPGAQTSLGYMYEQGRGVPGDYIEALRWFRKAAEQGYAAAQNNLGVAYRDGRGVEKDDAVAVAWFRKAAEQGYAEGQNNLGFMYESGRGVAKDDAEAVRWYRMAANQGNSLAQNNLALIAKKGIIASGSSRCEMVQIDEWLVRFARNRWLVIDGAINGQKVGILLDTGAMRTMIFRPVAAQLGLTMHRVRGWVVGIGGDSIAESADVGEFKIGESTRRKWQMMVAGEHDPGDGIGVLLGEDFFQNVDVEFDLANRVVRLFQPRNCAGTSLAYWTTAGAREVEIEAIIDKTRPRIVLPVRINGLPIVALFDTGAGTSILHRVIAGRLGVRPGTPGVVAVEKVGGVGKESIDVWVGPFESFEIGNEAIKTTSIPFGDIGTTAQMLLGTDFLLAHRVLISHSQRRIYFTYSGGPVFLRKSALEGSNESRSFEGAAPIVTPLQPDSK